MWITKSTTTVALFAALAAITGGLLAQQAAEKPAVAEAKAKADSPELAKTEAKLAKLGEIIRPQPGEHVTSIAKIAWQRDPWEAAVKAGKEGKPILVFTESGPPCGVVCGYG